MQQTALKKIQHQPYHPQEQFIHPASTLHQPQMHQHKRQQLNPQFLLQQQQQRLIKQQLKQKLSTQQVPPPQQTLQLHEQYYPRQESSSDRLMFNSPVSFLSQESPIFNVRPRTRSITRSVEQQKIQNQQQEQQQQQQQQLDASSANNLSFPLSSFSSLRRPIVSNASINNPTFITAFPSRTLRSSSSSSLTSSSQSNSKDPISSTLSISAKENIAIACSLCKVELGESVFQRMPNRLNSTSSKSSTPTDEVASTSTPSSPILTGAAATAPSASASSTTDNSFPADSVAPHEFPLQNVLTFVTVKCNSCSHKSSGAGSRDGMGNVKSKSKHKKTSKVTITYNKDHGQSWSCSLCSDGVGYVRLKADASSLLSSETHYPGSGSSSSLDDMQIMCLSTSSGYMLRKVGQEKYPTVHNHLQLLYQNQMDMKIQSQLMPHIPCKDTISKM